MAPTQTTLRASGNEPLQRVITSKTFTVKKKVKTNTA